MVLRARPRQSSRARGYEPTLIPEFTYASAQDAATIDLVKLWAAVWRNRLVIATIVIVSLAFGVLSLFLSEPTYRATASVEINNQPVKVLGTEEFQQSSSSQGTKIACCRPRSTFCAVAGSQSASWTICI